MFDVRGPIKLGGGETLQTKFFTKTVKERMKVYEKDEERNGPEKGHKKRKIQDIIDKFQGNKIPGTNTKEINKRQRIEKEIGWRRVTENAVDSEKEVKVRKNAKSMKSTEIGDSEPLGGRTKEGTTVRVPRKGGGKTNLIKNEKDLKKIMKSRQEVLGNIRKDSDMKKKKCEVLGSCVLGTECDNNLCMGTKLIGNSSTKSGDAGTLRMEDDCVRKLNGVGGLQRRARDLGDNDSQLETRQNGQTNQKNSVL